MVSYPTKWRAEDLRDGMIIHNPPLEEVDPVTRRSTGRLAKFRVASDGRNGFSLTPYHGPEPAVTPERAASETTS